MRYLTSVLVENKITVVLHKVLLSIKKSHLSIMIQCIFHKYPPSDFTMNYLHAGKTVM